MKTYQSKNYPSLEASENAWNAVGYYVVGNPEVWPGDEAHEGHTDPVPSRIVSLMIGQHGLTETALYAAAAEHQRRKEEQTRATAIAREAEGLMALAASIRGAAEQSVLDRVLGSLSERTQYAVRAQLKGTAFAR